MRKFKRLTLTLALLLTAVGGAWAEETPLLTIESKDYTSFTSGSKTFDDKVTVTFSNPVYYDGEYGWYADGTASLLTVAVTNGYTITSCKFYSIDGPASTGYTVVGESPSVYLSASTEVYTDANQSEYIGFPGITKIEVYGAAEPEITEWELKPDDTGKNWILADMPASNIELQVEYYAESNLFLSKDALADKANIAVKAGELGVQFGNDGKSANTITEGTPMTVTYNGTKKVIGVKVEKKKAVDPANAYMKWDADQKKLVATEIPTTATKVENANENVEWQGTYVVEGEVTINGTITLSGDVNLIIKDGAKLTAQGISGESKNLYIYGQANQSGQLVVNGSGTNAINSLTTLEVHSAKVTATSSYNYCGGFFEISTFNVYGGSVDAKCTGSDGLGIGLSANGSMKIYGGEVKAEGTGNGGIFYYYSSDGKKPTVTVYGGKLWAGDANKKALYNVNLTKGAGFTGKIETCADNSAWAEYNGDTTPTTKYVRVGY